jgi:hypothetical protein
MEPSLLLQRLQVLVVVLPAPLRPLDHRHQRLFRHGDGIRDEQTFPTVRAAFVSFAGSQQRTVAKGTINGILSLNTCAEK